LLIRQPVGLIEDEERHIPTRRRTAPSSRRQGRDDRTGAKHTLDREFWSASDPDHPVTRSRFAESLAEKLWVRRRIAGYGDKPMPVLQRSEDAAGNREVVRFARKIAGSRLGTGSLVRKANFGCGHHPIRHCDCQNAGTFARRRLCKGFPMHRLARSHSLPRAIGLAR
jgi:hypothetical protein